MLSSFFFFFFFNDTATTEIYTLSLHDALPISAVEAEQRGVDGAQYWGGTPPPELTVGYLTTVVGAMRSEEHTSELQSPCNLVCRLLLEKKKKKKKQTVSLKDQKT